MKELNSSISTLKKEGDNVNILDDKPKTVDNDVKIVKISLN